MALNTKADSRSSPEVQEQVPQKAEALEGFLGSEGKLPRGSSRDLTRMALSSLEPCNAKWHGHSPENQERPPSQECGE